MVWFTKKGGFSRGGWNVKAEWIEAACVYRVRVGNETVHYRGNWECGISRDLYAKVNEAAKKQYLEEHGGMPRVVQQDGAGGSKRKRSSSSMGHIKRRPPRPDLPENDVSFDSE